MFSSAYRNDVDFSPAPNTLLPQEFGVEENKVFTRKGRTWLS